MGKHQRSRSSAKSVDGGAPVTEAEVASAVAAAASPQPTLAIGGRWIDIKNVKLHATVVDFLNNDLCFPTMAPVQAQTIPLLMGHHDVVVEAVTGSGKTLAYVVPALEALLRPGSIQACKDNPRAVIAAVIVPTRELALQVFGIVQRFVAFANVRHQTAFAVASLIGGRSLEQDLSAIMAKGANVVIGTPGRMFEILVSSKHSQVLTLSTVELLVLDEADRLLDMGFKAKLDALLRRFPKQRRTGLFSATQTKELAELARAGMRNPVAIRVRLATLGTQGEVQSKPQIPELLSNFYCVTSPSEKLDRLLAFLAAHPTEKVLVYVMTCAAVDWLFAALSKVLLAPTSGSGAGTGAPRPVHALHGQMQQHHRQRSHEAVSKSTNGVLVCTDVAARGLDIPEVGTVVQYDPPVDPHTFIHRIGRTARMGRSGASVVMLTPQELEYVAFMKLQNVPLMPLDVDRDDADTIDFTTVDRRRTLASTYGPKATPAAADGEKAADKDSKEGTKSDPPVNLTLKQQLRALGRHATRQRGEVEGDLCASPAVLALRRASRAQPELLDLATKAFVSFVRAYKEHECRYIFQLKNLDVTDLVHSFALFKVPNCGEIRKMSILKIPIQEEFNDILERLAAQRQAKLAANKRQREEEIDQEAEDITNRERNAMRHRTERNQRLESIRKDKNMTRGAKSAAWKQAELDDLCRESYYIKKERMGRISKRTVDEIVGNDAIENATMSTRERASAKKSRK